MGGGTTGIYIQQIHSGIYTIYDVFILYLYYNKLMTLYIVRNDNILSNSFMYYFTYIYLSPSFKFKFTLNVIEINNLM